MNLKPAPHDNELGVTLIELVIYAMLAAVFLLIVSGIFINGWLSQTATAERDAATGGANLLTASLQQSVRNASAINVPSGAADSLVAVVSTGASGGWQCRAWVRLGNGDLRYRTSTTVIDMSGASDYTSGSAWSTLVSGIQRPDTGAAIFVATSPKGLTYSFKAENPAKSMSVPVSGSVTAQAIIPGGGSCW